MRLRCEWGWALVLAAGCGSGRYLTFDVNERAAGTEGGRAGAPGQTELGGTAGTPELSCPSSCNQGTPVCDPSSGRCVECLADTDCEEGRCHPTARRCVACVADRDCETGRVCDLITSVCSSVCSSSATCSEEEPICHPGRLICVQCLADGDCGEELCDVARATCVDCRSDADCEGGSCEAGECVGE